MLMNWLRKYQRTVLGVVVVSFVASMFVGFGLYLRSGASHFDTAAEVNGEKIPYRHFTTIYNQVVNRKRDNKEELSPDALKQLKQEVLQSLIQESVFYKEAERFGFQLSDQELAMNLTSIPAFQKEGKFDVGAYVNMLQTVIRSSPQEFEETQRRQILIGHLRSFIMQAIKVTDKEVELEMAVLQAAQDPKKKTHPLDKEELRKQISQEKGSDILNRWYQQLGTNVKLKVYLDEIEKRG